jgi:hypothetical protein
MTVRTLSPQTRLFRVAAAAPLATREDRTVDYVFSDESVARDGDTIRTAGWDLAAYLANPVFLWAHDSSAPPIGKVIEIGAVGAELRGTVSYAEADEYPFADTIYRLTQGGFLNATSVSWLPRKWRQSADKSRPGGIDFLEQELLEISAVPVPALSTALATARGAGIDTTPIFEWASRALDLGGFAAVPRAELESLRKEAKMAVASRAKPAADPAAAAADPAPIAATAAAAPKLTKRSLWHVGWLASLLADLGWVQKDAEWEAAIEEDGSTVPAEMLEAMKALGAVLVKMTIEEVNELIAGDDEDDLADVALEMASGPGLKRAAFRALRRLDAGALAAVNLAMRRHIAGERVAFTVDRAAPVALARAGRILSAENERCLRDAHGHMTQACDMVRGVFEQVDEPEGDGGDDEARALEARRAAALKRRAGLPAA